jgi:hypothetical protein
VCTQSLVCRTSSESARENPVALSLGLLISLLAAA